MKDFAANFTDHQVDFLKSQELKFRVNIVKSENLMPLKNFHVCDDLIVFDYMCALVCVVHLSIVINNFVAHFSTIVN